MKGTLKTLALSELRYVAECTRVVKIPVTPKGKHTISHQAGNNKKPSIQDCIERVPWRVWYVSASNGDVIRGEECVTLSVDVPPNCPGAFPTRLVQFTSSGQIRRLRDSCILRANDFILRCFSSK